MRKRVMRNSYIKNKDSKNYYDLESWKKDYINGDEIVYGKYNDPDANSNSIEFYEDLVFF